MATFDRQIWAAVPFHFWTVVLFIFGSMVGSLLNVCIHRMPRGESIVSPPSHCPHCHYTIPWYLNIPLVTWLFLRGKCKNCSAPISVRYFLVELLTGVLFLCAWIRFGQVSALLALSVCLLLAGFVVATFIDLEHFIIPDEVTIGGIVAGFLLSALVPQLQNVENRAAALRESFYGIAVGGGLIYLILRGGKLLFGKKRLVLEPDSRVIFNETSIKFPDQEIRFEELFYRKSDAVLLHAKTVELEDRCYFKTFVKLTPDELIIGEEKIDPSTVPRMEVVTDQMVVPQEAMGFGDVKFMAAIGAFMGWPAVIFAIFGSSIVGAAVSLIGIALKRQEFTGRIPYGPYIALAASFWLFMPAAWQDAWRANLLFLIAVFSGRAGLDTYPAQSVPSLR
ncbi:MAG: prepilin peptidase [Verrucomicrobiota bacterium]|nr:prepilin peptidase [Verrucomicrobiota bacterium]